MQLSSFVLPDQVDRVAAAGGEYVELFFAGKVSSLTNDEFDDLAKTAQDWPLRPDRFAGLLPGTISAAGPDVNIAEQNEYLTETFSRMNRLSGGEAVVVFGSGRSRAIPEGFGRDHALDQLEEFMRRASALAKDEGITVVLEPLNRKECNVFNSVSEGGAFLRERDLPDTKLLADLYHMMEENEPISSVVEYGDLIVHTHIADTLRKAPGTGTYPLLEFFTALHQVGYDGKCSIECRWDDFDSEVGPALEYCREVRQAAGY